MPFFVKAVRRAIPLLLALALPAPVAAVNAAIPAISCHCFQNRSYDAARPAAVDPFLLATTQNSLMAAVYGLDKKSLVRERMAGVSGDALWVAHYLAARCGRAASSLMAARNGSEGSWKTAAASCAEAGLGVRFAALLKGNATDKELAAAAVDEVLVIRLGVTRKDLEEIRLRGGSNAEAILAAYLAGQAGRPAEIHAEVYAGRATWGQVLERVGGNPCYIEEDIRRLVR